MGCWDCIEACPLDAIEGSILVHNLFKPVFFGSGGKGMPMHDVNYRMNTN